MKRHASPACDERPQTRSKAMFVLSDGSKFETSASEVAASPVLQLASNEGSGTKLPFVSAALKAWRRVRNGDECSVDQLCKAAGVRPSM